MVIQATSRASQAARRDKLEAAGYAALWKGAGAVLEIWSWANEARGASGSAG